MKAFVRWIGVMIVLAGLSGVLWSEARAQTPPEGRYFSETGHWVSGDFLEKYNSASNPETIYGLPITDAFTDPTSGRLIQYFENARFELHPEEIEDLRVQLTPLGELLYVPGKSLPTPPNYPACTLFPQTNQSVCYAFLEYFEANGGVSQFGYPISGFESHDGWISQYFQRARFEWHPEMPPCERVQLADLGRQYFHTRGENPALLKPVPRDFISQQPATRLQAHAFVSQPVMPRTGEQQILYVIVYDQNFRPVERAEISYQVKLPSGEIFGGELPLTDEEGVSSANFAIPGDVAGTGEIIITVTSGLLQIQTATAFQLW